MNTRLILGLSMLCVLACEEPTTWELDSKNHDLIVVEGILTNELKRQKIILSRPFEQLNATPEPVSGALVAVRAGSEVQLFSEFPTGSGVYYSDTIQAVVNRQYQLYILFNDIEYTALAEMVPATPVQPLAYHLVDADSMIYEIDHKDSEQPSIQEYWISWAHVAGYEGLPQGQTLSHSFHYTLSSINVNEVFKPAQARVRFPRGAIVLRKKYSLSTAHEAFLRTFLSETEWRGSVFDVQKGNVATNLSEGAIGFFAVSTVVSDTTLVAP
ncbi:MAG: DUF4249 domain-containing protein [Cyclobacteriaceae bacterium]|nr:DUF4249 domain-containing protein [Cyclobacteriaceae bacterium]